MKDMRVMGNMIEKLSRQNNDSPETLSIILDCEEDQVLSLFRGRIFPSFEQMLQLANHFNVTVDELMDGDESYYEQNVVHCMGQFENPAHREEILDIIDDYLRLKSTVGQ